MAIKVGRNNSRAAQEHPSDLRVTIRFDRDTLDGLAAWARAENRSPAAQGRFLLEQAVTARGDRLALTRR